MRTVLLLVLAAGCTRDLTLPPEALPPKIDSIAPVQGFAGDIVTLTGANLADPSLQVTFDVRTALVLTPAQERDGKTLKVQVPADVLGTDVSVSTSQGTAKSSQPFTYLGLGHPRTVALRATVPLKPNISLTFPLTGGTTTALLDWRYGTVVAEDAAGQLSIPARVGVKPVLAFGPPAAAWVLDAPDSGQLSLVPFDMTGLRPEAGTPITGVSGFAAGADGSPSGGRFAIPSGRSVVLYQLPAGTHAAIPIPGLSADIVLVKFAGNDTLLGLTTGEPFRIDLSGAPAVSVGAAFDTDAQPPPYAAAAVSAQLDRLAYTTWSHIRFLTWGPAGAPVLDAVHVVDPKIVPHAVAFTADAAQVLVGDELAFVVAACDVASGKVLSAQAVPGLGSLALVRDGDNQGFFTAAIGTGSALLFPSTQVLRTNPVSAQLREMAVDPKCGDLIVATAFGPLQLPSATLTPLAVDSSLQLDGVQASDGGIVAWANNDLYAWLPPPSCRGLGSFRHIATAEQPSVGAALSADGKWVATSDGEVLELIPRSDGSATLPKQKLDFGIPALVPVRYSANSLTVGHPLPGGKYGLSTYKEGTLQETATLPLDSVAVRLERVRFAQAWIIDEEVIENGDFVATGVTVWDEQRGVLAQSTVPASFTVPAGISADGFMLLGVSTVGRDSGLDTLILQVSGTRLVQEVGPHVDLPGSPAQVLSSPDGGRIYAALPDESELAVVE